MGTDLAITHQRDTAYGGAETYGIIHLITGSDGAISGVTNGDLFNVDVSSERIIYLDPPPIPDLYQIVEGQPGVFYHWCPWPSS